MRASLLAAAGAVLLAAQVVPPPGTELLNRIRERAAENLQGLPNYTCLETVARSERAPSASRFEPVDTLRLEVALSDGKEMFAWPGADEFLEDKLLAMVQRGTIGTGGFAMHARNVFLTSWPDFVYAGEEAREQRRLIRYDYRVPSWRGGFLLIADLREIVVGFRGSFWVDADSLDLVRLEVMAENIPMGFGITATTDAVEYTRVQIGETSYLLPSSEEIMVTDATGTTSHNSTRFSGCRQFTGHSVVSFGEPSPAEAPNAPQPATEVSLPAGLVFAVALETPVTSDASYVGQPVKARVLNTVKRGGEMIIPKGAAALGRVVELQIRTRPIPHIRVGLQFSRIEFGRSYAKFTARLDALQLLGRSNTPPTPTRVRLPEPPAARAFLSFEPAEQTTGVASLTATTTRLRLPADLHLVWRTEAPQPKK